MQPASSKTKELPVRRSLEGPATIPQEPAELSQAPTSHRLSLLKIALLTYFLPASGLGQAVCKFRNKNPVRATEKTQEEVTGPSSPLHSSGGWGMGGAAVDLDRVQWGF